MSNFEYTGEELDLFEHANNWKAYWRSQIKPHMGKTVLEVGAGIGANIKVLWTDKHKKWVCLEPDASLCEVIQKKIDGGSLPSSLDLRAATITDIDIDEKFDTIIYIDVLEHIDTDRDELFRAAQNLEEGGKILIISPSHNFLFSEFDKKVGHYRRYNKEMLRGIAPDSMQITELKYLDSVGFFASLANRLLLRSDSPSHTQIQFWDRFLVKISRFADPWLGYNFGKTILCVIEKPEN